jgi:hypothetical protein
MQRKREKFKQGYKNRWGYKPDDSENVSDWDKVIDSIPEHLIDKTLDKLEELNRDQTLKGYRPHLAMVKIAFNDVKTRYKPINTEEDCKQYPQWRIDAANKLGINVKNLPYHARSLTKEQRQILDIPETDEALKILRTKFKTISKQTMF